MADEVTTGELVRRFDALREWIREDLSELRQEMRVLSDRVESKTVGVDIYKLRHAALEDKCTVLERRIDLVESERRAEERAREAALVAETKAKAIQDDLDRRAKRNQQVMIRVALTGNVVALAAAALSTVHF